MIGQTVSHYRILEKLGEGGMGVVYKAEDLTLDRHVALKFLSKELGIGESAKKRFIREAKAASALEHPNICSIYEIDQAPDGSLFTVMPCYEGETLRERLEKGPLDIDEALEITTQVTSALARAHEKGIVHRDIKPGNVMLTDGGRQAKLMDFGLAKKLDATRVTRTGMTVGTVAYMSPEQALGKDTDHRTDIWSLGVMLYEMLTGRLPFRGDVEPALLYSLINEEPESVRTVRREVPPQVETIIEKALIKDIEKRYQGMDELLGDLEEQRDKWALGIKERRFITLRRRTRRKLLQFLIPTAIVAVTALAVFVYQKFKPIPPEAIARENSMAIMYFENMADPQDTDKTAGMITQLLTTGLGDSEYIKVIGRQRVYDILKQLGKEDQKVVDRNTASEVAKRAGVNWAMTGTVIQTQPNLVVSADIWHSVTGEVRVGIRKRFEAGEDVMAAVDALIQTIGEDLSLPRLATEQLDRSVTEVTTHSVDAYRYYVEGMDYLQKGYGPEARVSFERALTYDSTFAMAYLRLATGRTITGDQKEKKSLIQRAERYAERASKKDQLYIKSARARFVGDVSEAIAGFEAIIETYPEEKDAYYELGALYDSRGNMDKAIACYEKVIELDPFEAYAYSLLSGSYFDRDGDLEASLSAINRSIALAPDHPDPYDTRAWLYAYEGRLDDAIASFNEALERNPKYFVSVAGIVSMHLFKREYEKTREYCRRLISSSEPWERGVGGYFMSFIPLYQGKLDEGLETLNLWIAADESAGYAGDQYANKLSLRSLVHVEKGNRELAVADADSLMKVCEGSPLEDLLFFDRVYVWARAGEFARAEGVLRSRLNKIDRSSRSQMRWYWIAKGCLEKEKGNLDTACNDLEKATEGRHGKGEWFARYYLAMAHLEADRPGRAVHEFEKALTVYGIYRACYPIEAVLIYYYLGTAYEKTGSLENAIQQYEVFLDIWKDADLGIDEVEDAKRRLTSLRGEI